MSLTIEGIKSSAGAAYQTVSTTLNHWRGRSIAWMQAGVQAAMPHLQDKKIAVISLAAVVILLDEFADAIARLSHHYLPNNKVINLVVEVAGISVVVAGVIGFVKYTQLPLTPLVVLGVGMGSIFFHNLVKNCFSES